MDQATGIETTRELQQVVVSHEMTVLLGRGRVGAAVVPQDAIAVVFGLGAIHTCSSLSIFGAARVSELLAADEPGGRIVLLLAPAVVPRIEGRTVPDTGAHQTFHLPAELRAIVLAMRDNERRGEAGEIYLAAKGIELVYETWAALDSGALTPLAMDSALSRADSERIVRARQLIDDRSNEKLTLEQIAALCGLNREKLTRGFREMFACSVAEAIAERRLTQASRMLATTDLPVSSIGYESGYMNNASFSRAFGRRFGVSPTDFRARQLAA
ncbi:MAG: AraC family transcriptional regulator [Brevundimonas sp.]|nr:MAG: AraC family transcriptional regulator [Brevundimonas sp.]